MESRTQSSAPTLRIVYGADEARRTILRRQPLEEYEAPPSLAAVAWSQPGPLPGGSVRFVP